MSSRKGKGGGKRSSLTPEEILARAARARYRFKAIVRHALANLYWLGDIEDEELGDNVQKNIILLTRKKDKKSLLTIQDKAILNKPAEDRTDQEKQHLNRVIGGLKCFRRYPSDVKSKLAAVTYFVYYGPGRVIVRQGHESHALYFLITGEVAVSQESFDPISNSMVRQEVAVMGPGSMFGEVSLLHDITRTATITTNTHCELLRLKKHDFDIVLKASVQQQWDEIKMAMARFTYFEGWDEISIRECCILAKMRWFDTNQTILGDDSGLRDFVYFIIKGKCQVVEHLLVKCRVKHGKKYYSHYDPPPESNLQEKKNENAKEEVPKSEESIHIPPPLGVAKAEKSYSIEKSESISDDMIVRHASGEILKKSESGKFNKSNISKTDLANISPSQLAATLHLSSKAPKQISQILVPSDVETHFMQVCLLNETACFGIGENMKHRRIIALVPTQCLLIPRYWLMQRNKGNIWNRVQQFLNSHVPSTKQIFQEFVNNRRWMEYRKKLVNEILANSKKTNTNDITNVPYFIRINEELD